MNKDISELQISPTDNILTAMKQMDRCRKKLLIVMSKCKYLGLISIGDIQRALINGHELTEEISLFMRNDYIVADPNYTIERVKSLMLKLRTEFMPVVNDLGDLVEVHLWDILFGEKKQEPSSKFNLPIVIMAGGIGSRLKPLTNVLPKPLIPINDKTLLEEIFDRFNHHGCDSFFISVNYKADLIKYYLEQLNLPFNINYFIEDKPLGTAGSLSLLKGNIAETFFVSNCDILIDQDYSEVLKYHKENNNEITIIAALKNYSLPYGTIESGTNGKLLRLIEKPDVTFKVNSGMYILEPHVLDEIPPNSFFHITQLIDKINLRNGKIGVFPVSERSWLDIGNWDEYLINREKNN